MPAIFRRGPSIPPKLFTPCSLQPSQFDSDPATRALAARFREEGMWGLDWLLKTSFGDGFRPDFSVMGLWTDGILGNNDDITSHAANNPYNNFLAAAAEAAGSRVLAPSDPDRAGHSRQVAEADWGFAVAALRTDAGARQGSRDGFGRRSGLGGTLEAHGRVPLPRQGLRSCRPTLVNSQQKSFMPWKPSPDRLLLYQSARRPRGSALLPSRPRTGSRGGAGPAVRGVSRRLALDGLVLHAWRCTPST